MATTKKTSTSKKSSTSKSTKNARNAPRAWSWRFSVLTVGIYLIIVTTLVVIAFAAAYFINNGKTADRLDRIKDIYSSINVDNEAYIQQDANVFGDKRVYEYDKGRSYSSSIRYVHADTVSNTVAELDAKIKAAGFTFFEEPYPGGAQVQYHYKSDKGEYVRLTVSSKPYDDATVNTYMMDKESAGTLFDKYDKNAGPSNVILKVNLDDNNE